MMYMLINANKLKNDTISLIGRDYGIEPDDSDWMLDTDKYNKYIDKIVFKLMATKMAIKNDNEEYLITDIEV